MSYEMIAVLMFATMLVMMLTGQRVFAAIGFVASGAALLLYGQGGIEMPFNAAFKLFNWYPMLGFVRKVISAKFSHAIAA